MFKLYPHQISKQEIHRLVGEGPTLIFEIGCHEGTDTQEFLDEFGPDLMLICFEPDPRPLKRFAEKINDSRVRVYQLGVSDKTGVATLYQSGGVPHNRPDITDWDYSSSLCRPTGHLSYSPWCTFDKSISVQTCALDEFLKLGETPAPRIDFIWMDTQGAEHLVIKGAKMALTHTRYVYTEFYNTPMYEGQQPLEALAALLPDFEVIGVYGSGTTKEALFRHKRLN